MNTPGQPDADPGSSADMPPFVIEIGRDDVRPNGDFTPSATLTITPGLHSSSLLTVLAAEDVKILLALLTFVHPNGHCQASAWQVADRTAAREGAVSRVLQRLADLHWQGAPAIIRIPRENWPDAYAPGPTLVRRVERPLAPPAAVEGHPYRLAGRDAVIAHSRATYARPRAEVEREIAKLNDWDVPELAQTPQERERIEARRRLRDTGMSADEADHILSTYPLERIQRQIAWLPERHAKSPRAYLVAAIEADYAPPRSADRHMQ